MNEQQKAAVLDALKPGNGLPASPGYKRLRDMPADVLATRVVGSLILAKGNLNEYANVIEALIVNMRAEYEDSPAEGAAPKCVDCGAVDGAGCRSMRCPFLSGGPGERLMKGLSRER